MSLRGLRASAGEAERPSLYDLGHQVLVDSMWTDSASSVTADEYVWLDGRPVLAFRGNLSATGAHSNDYVDTLDTGAGNCSRPIDEGQVNCGLFHLVSNLQGFVNVAIHDGTGLVASVMLPDADGTVNQPRMMSAGGYGTAWAQRFNVPASFSKQARFRTSWTGGLPGWGNGVDAFKLDGQTVLTGGPTTELGQAWSSWGPTVTGSADVVWSTTCGGACMSAADQFEWRTWETGAARFQTRLRFPGQYADAETDFYENWNRYYDPPTGRYWSPEPLASSADFMREEALLSRSAPAYAYAATNPVQNSDPTGLATCFETCRQLAASEFVRCVGSNRGCDSSGDNTAYCSQIALKRSSSCRENLCKKEPSRNGKPDKYKDEWDEQRGPYPDYSSPQKKKYKFQTPKTLPAGRLQ